MSSNVKVRIPTPLRKLTNDTAEVSVTAGQVSEMIDGLESQFPGFKDRICDEDGEIRRFVNVFVGEEDIRFLGGTSTVLSEGAEVSIIPAMAGGSV